MKYFVIFLILIGFVGTAFAVPALLPEDDFRYSDHVVTGKIIYSEIIIDPREDNSAATFYDTIIYKVKVEKWHKNPLADDIITVYGTHFPNDVVPEPNWGVLEFEIGDIVYLYIDKTDDGLKFREYSSRLLISKVSGAEIIPPPLKQIKEGVALIDIQCSEGKYAVYKYNRMRVACVSEETLNELWLRGWATMRLAMPGDDISEALCNNYGGKWHPEYDGCRDISDLQCSLIGGKFNDLKICEDGICPDRIYEICVTENEKPEPEHTSEAEMKLIYAKQKLQEIYTLNSSFGSFTIKDAIVGYGIAGDSLVVDVLEKYYESDLDLIKQKIQDIVGSEITIIFSPSGAIVPTNIESIFPYVWNNFLHRNGIEFAPKEQTYSNHDEGFYDVDKVCSPLIASNGTEFYISSTFIYEPFEITGTLIDKTKPDDCHKVWKTDTVMVEPDITLGLWLENYHNGN